MTKAWVFGVLFAAIFICKGGPLDQWTWRAPLLPGDNIRAIASGNGQLVAVGQHGNIITSLDGTNWVSRYIGMDIEFRSIAFGKGLFVAVGWNLIDSYARGAIFISTNAIDWALATNSESIWALHGVAYGNSDFVAVGSAGGIYSSGDGIHWSWCNDSSDCCGDLESVCYGNGQFVVVQGAGSFIVSSNATHWVEYGSGIASGFSSIIAGNGLYVASGSYDIIMTSTNAINWSNSGTSHPSSCIGFGNDRFIASDGEVSTDGVEWIPGSPKLDGQITGVVWNKDQFVAVGSVAAGVAVFTSVDGSEWDLANPGNLNSGSSIIYAQDKFVAVGSGILISSNGITWTAHNTGTASGLSAIEYGNEIFVAVGDCVWNGTGNIATILTSPNGSNWTQTTNLPSTFPSANRLWAIAHGDNLFVAVGGGGTILTSSDGSNWVQQISGVSNSLYGIACGKDGRFVTVGESGSWDGKEYPNTILTSLDGTNWTSIFHADASTLLNGGELLLAVAYGAGQYVAVGTSDILTSPDGLHWTNYPGIGGCLQSVAYGNGQFVAVGTSYRGGIPTPIGSSVDGHVWVSRFSGTSQGLYGIAYGNGVFEAVGFGILESQPIIRLGLPAWLPDGSLKIPLEGKAGITNTVQASSDLSAWFDLTNVILASPTGSFVGPFATNYVQRFYRSIVH